MTALLFNREIQVNKEKYIPAVKPTGWEKIALDVLAGRWNKADDSTVDSLLIGLKHVESENGRKAIEALTKTFKIQVLRKPSWNSKPNPRN